MTIILNLLSITWVKIVLGILAFATLNAIGQSILINRMDKKTRKEFFEDEEDGYYGGYY